MTKRFISRLASELEAFVRFKQNLGHPYVGVVLILRSFDAYVAEHHPSRGRLDWAALLTGWLSGHAVRKAGTVRCNLSAMRQFCLFRRRYDPDAFVPDYRWAPPKVKVRFLAHVLSREQVSQLIRSTNQLKNVRLRRKGMRALICILYSCSAAECGGSGRAERWREVPQLKDRGARSKTA